MAFLTVSSSPRNCIETTGFISASSSYTKGIPGARHVTYVWRCCAILWERQSIDTVSNRCLNKLPQTENLNLCSQNLFGRCFQHEEGTNRHHLYSWYFLSKHRQTWHTCLPVGRLQPMMASSVMQSRCFTMPRRELPWAATRILLPAWQEQKIN